MREYSEKEIARIKRIYWHKPNENHVSIDKFPELKKYDYIFTNLALNHNINVFNMRKLINLLNTLECENNLEVIDDELLYFLDMQTPLWNITPIDILETLILPERKCTNDYKEYYQVFNCLFDNYAKLGLSLCVVLKNVFLKKLYEICKEFTKYYIENMTKLQEEGFLILKLYCGYIYRHFDEFEDIFDNFMIYYEEYLEELRLYDLKPLTSFFCSDNLLERIDIFDNYINSKYLNKKLMR